MTRGSASCPDPRRGPRGPAATGRAARAECSRRGARDTGPPTPGVASARPLSGPRSRPDPRGRGPNRRRAAVTSRRGSPAGALDSRTLRDAAKTVFLPETPAGTLTEGNTGDVGRSCQESKFNSGILKG